MTEQQAFSLLIEVVRLDVRYYIWVQIAADSATVSYELSDKCAAHVVKPGVYEAHVGWQRGLINGIAVTRIDDYGIVLDYLTAVAPLTEELPVVGTYEEGEAVLRIVLREMLQSVPCV